MEKLIFCIIVEDEPLAQQVLENYIGRLDQLKLVSKCESIEEAYEVIMENHVDVVFLDLNLESVPGIDLVKKIETRKGGSYYFIITSSLSPDKINTKKIFQSDNFELIDYLTKPFSFERFLQSIEKIKQIKK